MLHIYSLMLVKCNLIKNSLVFCINLTTYVYKMGNETEFVRIIWEAGELERRSSIVLANK